MITIQLDYNQGNHPALLLKQRYRVHLQLCSYVCQYINHNPPPSLSPYYLATSPLHTHMKWDCLVPFFFSLFFFFFFFFGCSCVKM